MVSAKEGAEWGNVLKSNSNRTYYGLSLEYINHNHVGYVDFEKMIGLNGIVLRPVQAGVGAGCGRTPLGMTGSVARMSMGAGQR